MAKTILEGFERRILFRLARLTAMSAIFLLFGLIAIGGAALIAFVHTTGPDVSPDEVISAIVTAEKESTAGGASSTSEGDAKTVRDPSEQKLRLPFAIQKYYDTEENLAVLKRATISMTETQRQAYLQQLVEVVTAAERSKVDPVDALNKFQELRLIRLEEYQRNEDERKSYSLYFAGLVATSLILIALLSLTLVLLAVERNTRKAAEQ